MLRHTIMIALFLRIDRNWPWVFPVLIGSACALLLAIALISQYVGGHHPCTLCIAQRTPYVVAAIVAGAAAYIGRDSNRSIERAMLLGVCSVTFLYGSVTAFEHVGVERGWWPGEILCSGSMTAFGVDEENATQLAANPLFNVPDVTCSQGTWALFGFTMATYNMIANIGLMLLTVVLAVVGLVAHRTTTV